MTPGAVNQARLDAILPSFLTAARPSAETGSTWIALGDLCLTEPGYAGDDAPEARQVEGPAPVADLRATTILPAGSRLRFLGYWLEMWGYGFCRGVYLHLEVETGALAGSRVAFADIDRWIVSGVVSRGTMAAARLVSGGTQTDDLPALLDDRRATIGSIVAAGQRRKAERCDLRPGRSQRRARTARAPHRCR